MGAQTIVRASALVLIVAGTSIPAAPEQTAQPGQMTQARVWVQNRGRGEAVPVELRDVSLDGPLKVQIINGEPQFAQTTSPVQVREMRRLWEYQSIRLQAADDMAARLTAQGSLGWETTGVWSATADGVTTVLLKRPR